MILLIITTISVFVLLTLLVGTLLYYEVTNIPKCSSHRKFFSLQIPPNVKKKVNTSSLNKYEILLWNELQQKIVHTKLVSPSNNNKKNNNNSIPKIIIQTFKNNVLPTNMFNATNSIRGSNLDFQYEYFDDKRCKKWLHSNFSDSQLAERIERAFDMLIPGAFKADIFRLAVLYELGGVYIDISMCVTDDTCNLSISEFLGSLPSTIEHVLVKDISHGGIYQAFIMSKPKSDLILYILKSITTQVLNKYEPPPKMKGRSLAYTGPLAFAKFLRQFWNLPKDHEFEYGAQKHDNSTYMLQMFKQSNADNYCIVDMVVANNNTLLQTKYNNWQQDRPKDSHYSSLSKKNQIYNQT